MNKRQQQLNKAQMIYKRISQHAIPQQHTNQHGQNTPLTERKKRLELCPIVFIQYIWCTIGQFLQNRMVSHSPDRRQTKLQGQTFSQSSIKQVYTSSASSSGKLQHIGQSLSSSPATVAFLPLNFVFKFTMMCPQEKWVSCNPKFRYLPIFIGEGAWGFFKI